MHIIAKPSPPCGAPPARARPPAKGAPRGKRGPPTSAGKRCRVLVRPPPPRHQRFN